MNKVNFDVITRELTADQVDAHNGNYSALADKDIEIYNELMGSCGKIYNAVIVSSVGTTAAQMKNADFVYTGSEDINAYIQSVSANLAYCKKTFKFIGFFNFNATIGTSKIVMPDFSCFDGSSAEVQGDGDFSCFEAGSNCTIDGFTFYGANNNIPINIVGNYVNIVNCKFMDNGDNPSLNLAVKAIGAVVKNCEFTFVDVVISANSSCFYNNLFKGNGSNISLTSGAVKNYFSHNIGMLTIVNDGNENIIE